MDINEVNRVCYVCGKKAGFVPKDKVVGICMDICDICGKRRACTDLWHDWQKKETIEDIVAYLRQQNLGMPDDMECVSPLVCDMLRLADRIEKAYKFMVEGLNDGIVERDQYIAELTDNNSKIIAELNEVRELNRKCCDENERIKQFDQEKDRLIEKLKSHLSTAINALAPKCVDCADVCDTCDCRHSAWIPFAKLLIAGLDYDESDYESLPLVSMTVNRTEIENLKDENARLRAAIQPVLDIVMDSATSDLSMELAISEAKRIYNESMKGKNNE